MEAIFYTLLICIIIKFTCICILTMLKQYKIWEWDEAEKRKKVINKQENIK